MKYNILIVEDDDLAASLIKMALGSHFELIHVKCALDALKEIEQSHFDLILLDINLPDEDGFHFCAKLRADERYKDIQIIFISAKSSPSDKILGFSVGADDYITKPFNKTELKARMMAKIRRLSDSKDRVNEDIMNGSFITNLSKQKIIVKTDGKYIELDLTPIEFRILNYFLQNEDHVLSRNQILNYVWGSNTHINDRTVDTHIYSLRKKMGEFSTCIKSIKSEGYRFTQAQLRESRQAG